VLNWGNATIGDCINGEKSLTALVATKPLNGGKECGVNSTKTSCLLNGYKKDGDCWYTDWEQKPGKIVRRLELSDPRLEHQCRDLECRTDTPFSEWSSCINGKSTRRRPYDGWHCEENNIQTKDCSPTAAFVVDETCLYTEYGPWSEHDPVSGAKTQSRILYSGSRDKCLDLIKTKTYNIIEIDVEKIDGQNKISLGVFDQDDVWKGWIIDPIALVVGENKIYTDITVSNVRIFYRDGGDIYLKDIKYDGVSIMATGKNRDGNDGLTRAAKIGKLFWRGFYDYTIV
jgi:hypothetical protein